MSKMWFRWSSAVVVVGCLAWSPRASADGVVDHLAEHGNLRRASAAAITAKISRAMSANAARGGNDYDRVRQAIGTALFGQSGAGATLQEYNARLEEVIAKLDRGFDLWALTALFGGDSIVNCREDFGLAKADCRALAQASIVAPVADVDGLLAEARTAFQSGNYSRAAEAYEQVTQSRSDDAAAFAGLGQSRIRIGDGRGAAQALRTAIELAPNVANLRAYLGRALMASGDRAGAAAAFREALSLNSNHLDAKAGLRELEPPMASPYAQRAPTPPPAPMPMPMPMNNTRNTVVASNVAPATAPRFGTPRFGPAPVAPMPIQRPMVAPQPSGGFGGGRFGGGQSVTVAPQSSGGFAGGRSVAVAPMTVAPAQELVQWMQKGDAHLQARQFPQALSAYNKAAVVNPNHAAAFAGIGVASMGAGDHAAASRALQTAVRLAPESADYNAALGNALAALGETETATAAFRRALTINPDHRAATAGLARLEGRTEEPAPVVAAAAPVPTRSGGRTATAAPTASAPVVAASEAEPTGDAVAEPAAPPEPVAPPTTTEDDDLISGLLADPLGPSSSRQRGGTAPRSSGGSTPPARGAAPPTAVPTSRSTAGLPQTPSREQISAAMRELLPIVKGCVPDRTGTISVQITIVGATGAVEDATVVGSGADDPEAICVGEVVRGATFPPFAKDKLSIKFPFQL
jgi:Flp pilus assembly protein TadD